jgi:subtilase family serine protease
MSYSDRWKSIARRSSCPSFDRLELRSMLSATPVMQVAGNTSQVEIDRRSAQHAFVAALVAKHTEAAHEAKIVRQDVAVQKAELAKVAEAAHKARLAKRAEAVQEARAARQALVHKPTKPGAKPDLLLTAQPIAIGSPTTPVGLPSMPVVQQVLIPSDIEYKPAGSDAAVPISGILTPAQVRTAYGINLLANMGAGTTIGIVDVDDDPNIVGDVAAFSAEFGLPQMDGIGGDPTFTKIEQPGTPTSPSNGSSSDTSTETALEVERAHSLAPLANIVLEEVSSFSLSNGSGGGLLPGVQTLVGTPGVTAISVSYGGAEFSGEASADTFFTTPFGSNPNPVAIAFSTGDGGAPEFPATSASVLAVGGTGLYLASARGRYGFETAWGDLSGFGAGGGGVSTQIATPTFQSSNGVNFGHRSVPDVSAVADQLTSVSVYNSWDAARNGGSPWFGVAGTSVASPVVTGIVDLSQELRIDAGLTPLSSPQINARLYAAYNSPNYLTYFHDVTVGNNTEVGGTTGFAATTGYDRATGIGSPVGNNFVMLLAAAP